MKADLTFSQNSQLTILTTKYGGDPFDDVPLLCTWGALSILFFNFMDPFYGWGSTASRLEPL